MSLLKRFTAICAVLILSVFYACSWDSPNTNGPNNSPNQSAEQSGSSSSSSGEGNEQSDQTSVPPDGDDDGEQGGGQASDGEQGDSSSDAGDTVIMLELSFDGTTVYWTDVSAMAYKVALNGSEHLTTQPQYEVIEEAGIYVVTVEGYDELGSPSTSFGTLEIAIQAPAPVLKNENGVIVWNKITGAIGYNVYINGAFITQESTNYYQPVTDGKYTVSAVFEDERLNSPMSEYLAIGTQPLDTPSIKIEGDTLSWSAVNGAEIYFICLDGEKRYAVFAPDTDIKLSAIFANNQAIAEDYPKGSTVTITVIAVSETALDSTPSNSVEYTV